MSIFFFQIKIPAESTHNLVACYRQLVFLRQRVRYLAFFENRFSVLDIKPLMIAANLTLGEVIWLLFELDLLVIRTKTV